MISGFLGRKVHGAIIRPGSFNVMLTTVGGWGVGKHIIIAAYVLNKRSRIYWPDAIPTAPRERVITSRRVPHGRNIGSVNPEMLGSRYEHVKRRSIAGVNGSLGSAEGN